MLGTLQDEQARLKAEYDRMEVCQAMCLHIHHTLFKHPLKFPQASTWSGFARTHCNHSINDMLVCTPRNFLGAEVLFGCCQM